MATLLLLIIYVAFISLGLPDALVGAAWPVMQPDFQIPYGYAGSIQFLVAGGTILSSMFSGLLINRFGTGKLTMVSVAMTALALLGFGTAPAFLRLIIAAIPLGLGAGAVDAALNAYVADHYESRHMSWLHSFWGIGALGGPMIIALLLSRGVTWRSGYKSLGLFQIFLVLILLLSLPLWDRVTRKKKEENPVDRNQHISLREAVKIKGVPMALMIFLFYCGIEASMGLWGGSFLFKAKGMNPAQAAAWVSFFFGSVTLGRLIGGFLTYRFSNDDMIRHGTVIILIGVVLMALPLPLPLTLAGFLLIGFGCAPIFPSMLHETPVRFGSTCSQAIIGFQIAVAYIGSACLPPLFGFIAGESRMFLLPLFLLAYIGIIMISYRRLTGLVGIRRSAK